MCLRIDAGRPIAHVAAEAWISRRCPAKWCARRRAHGENGLLGHSSRPATRPAAAARRHTRVGDRSPQPGEARTQPARGPRSTNWRAAARGARHRQSRIHVPAFGARRPLPAHPHRGVRPPLCSSIRRCLTDDGACYRSTTWADTRSPRSVRRSGPGRASRASTGRWKGISGRSPTSGPTSATAQSSVNAALGGRPPISRTAGSGYRIVFDQPPEPRADVPQQLTFEDFEQPRSRDTTPS